MPPALASLPRHSDLWWAETIASSYAAVALNLNPLNASITVDQARILKKFNPRLKLLVYSNSEIGPITHTANAVINAHPEWWARDDDGNALQHGSQGYILNHSGHADLRAWHISFFKQVFGAEAEQLLDGLFFDGMGYSPSGLHNTNLARNDAWFDGKMKLGDEARAMYSGLNGGEIWGNAALGVTARYHNFTYEGQPVGWQTSMAHLDTGFLVRPPCCASLYSFPPPPPPLTVSDLKTALVYTTTCQEGAGCMWYMNTTTGEWIPDFFQTFLEGVINASTAGNTVVLHFNPGPSFPPFITYPPGPPPPPFSRCEVVPEGQELQVRRTAPLLSRHAARSSDSALLPAHYHPRAAARRLHRGPPDQ